MVDEMKARELREMTIEELMIQQEELSEKLTREKIQLSIKRLDNPLQIRVTKRDLARVNTVINERLRAGETAAVPGENETGEADTP
jgi:large subunit ribosomal protein L29